VEVVVVVTLVLVVVVVTLVVVVAAGVVVVVPVVVVAGGPGGGAADPIVSVAAVATVGVEPVLAGENATVALLDALVPTGEAGTVAVNATTCDPAAASVPSGAVTELAVDVQTPHTTPSSLIAVGV
jgi:hypothetical protein